MRHLNHKTASFLVFSLIILFYIFSLLPSLAWGDGVKLQSEVISGESFVLSEMPSDEFSPDPFLFSKVGVAAWDHPLYIVLGHLLVRALPFIPSLWLVNFISAFFGAGAVALVFVLSHRFTGSLLASLYASLALAVSHTFWWHSSTPEVYTLLAFLLLACFHFYDRFEAGGARSDLFYSALGLGLSAATHLMGFLTLPALGLHYLLSKRYRHIRHLDAGQFASAAAGFLAGFSLYMMQFFRMLANFSLDEILGPAVGSPFLEQLPPLSPASLAQSLLTYLFFLAVQFGPIGLLLGGVGFTNTNAPRKTLSFFIVFALFGIFYRVSDQFTFFIPSYLFWAIAMGAGAERALAFISRQWIRFALIAVMGLTIAGSPFFYIALPNLAARAGLDDDSAGIPQVGTGVRNGLAYYVNPYKRGDTTAYDFGFETLIRLERNSVVIAHWYADTDEYFVLRYFTKIEGMRPDVTLLGWSLHAPASFDPQLVRDAIDISFPNHPVYLASLSERFYAASALVERYCIVSENNLYRLYQPENGGKGCLDKGAVTP
jgi:hypothetical protein